ncbi:MAG: hypothetical protein F6K55_31120 [Moorea sp. SIO4A3]|nr:hypothetical protein [Moorena sp. SIO4A3]
MYLTSLVSATFFLQKQDLRTECMGRVGKTLPTLQVVTLEMLLEVPSAVSCQLSAYFNQKLFGVACTTGINYSYSVATAFG